MSDNENKYPKVAIIVLNWNGWEDTIKCLESVYQTDYPNYRVIVVDNGSTDRSIQKIREYAQRKITPESNFFEYQSNNKPISLEEYEEGEVEGINSESINSSEFPNVDLIKNEKNYGFAKGNNIGIKFALKKYDPSYVLLLNNDTIAFQNKWLRNMVNVAEDEEVGIVGCKLLYPNGEIQHAGARVSSFGPTAYQREKYKKKTTLNENEYVTGACILIKRTLIEKIGLLDEEFSPLFGEEVDYCFRCRSAGFKIVYTPKSKLIHFHGISTNKRRERPSGKDEMFYITRKNNILLALQNFPLYLIALQLLGEVRDFISIFLNYKNPNESFSFENLSMEESPGRRLKLFFKSYFDNLRNLNEIFRKRKNRTVKIWY